jgi:hypothetical protein
MFACENNNKKIAVALVNFGADMEAKNNVSMVWDDGWRFSQRVRQAVNQLVAFSTLSSFFSEV